MNYNGSPTPKRSIINGLILITMFMVVSSWAIHYLANLEKNRDYNTWQRTLGILADTKVDTVNRWLNKTMEVPQELARNPSLQLYSQQLVGRTVTGEVEGEKAQLSYLRNLLSATALRYGFVSSRRTGEAIKANLVVPADNGLAIVGSDLKIVIATPGFIKPSAKTSLLISKTITTGKPIIVDMYLDKKHQPILGFLVPFKGLQPKMDKAIGVIYAYKNANTLFTLLQSVGGISKSSETMLVRLDNQAVTYLTPLTDGSTPLQRQISRNAGLVSSYAVSNPGMMGTLNDYSDHTTIFTSRPVPETRWTLIQKINKDEALRESNRHYKFLIIALSLTALAIAMLFIASWWHGKSIQDQALAKELQQKSGQLTAQNHLLDAINSNISDFILLTGADSKCIFANSHLARQFDSAPDDFKGKSLAIIFGTKIAGELLKYSGDAKKEGRPLSTSMIIEITSSVRHLHITFTPISYEEEKDSVLITMHDVTKLHEARQNEAKLMQQLIAAMMAAIDRHDPYSANHSAKTAKISKSLGQAMNLDHDALDTLDTAATLCNLGKLAIDKELLTKTDKLSEEELREIRQEAGYVGDILQEINFKGPVRDTIIQKNEHLDGSGYPSQLSGDAIIPTARILAVANAFVAMISPRAYREKLSNREALEQILKEAGRRYDRKVLAALFQVVENEIDWSQW